jgi:hypothetical protein
MSTRRPVVDAIVASLLKAGHSPSNILIFDRYVAEMNAAGWAPGRRDDGVLVTATSPLVGYDPKVFYNCSYAGQLIWGDLEFKGGQWDKTQQEDKNQLSRLSYYSKIVTQQVDVLINVPVLTSDEGIGLQGSIVNLALGVVDNQRRFFRPFFGREENIADLATNKALQGKWVLNIVDGLLAQYAGGASFDPKYVSRENAIWLSEDPVALDAIALKLINEQRPSAKINKISESPPRRWALEAPTFPATACAKCPCRRTDREASCVKRDKHNAVLLTGLTGLLYFGTKTSFVVAARETQLERFVIFITHSM